MGGVGKPQVVKKAGNTFCEDLAAYPVSKDVPM